MIDPVMGVPLAVHVLLLAMDDGNLACVFEKLVSMAQGEWILFLESHERFVEEEGNLREELRVVKCDAFTQKAREVSDKLLYNYRNLDEYMSTMWQMNASPNGVFGMRLMYEHFVALCDSHGTANWPRHLLDRIRQPAWIFLRRRDRIGQTISLYKPQLTGADC